LASDALALQDLIRLTSRPHEWSFPLIRLATRDKRDFFPELKRRNVSEGHAMAWLEEQNEGRQIGLE
jgi:hypothetical protein